MIKTYIVAVATLPLLAMLPGLAVAKSIRSDMTADQLATYCATAGVGTTTTTTVDAGGKMVTGSVHCTAKDLVTASAGTDAGESETGPSEAAENGQED